MRFKHSFVTLFTLGALMLPQMLSASDFEWRLNLNLRSHSDPYGYRYGLVNRFGMMESDVMLILNRVYEPSDAYMIFRLAELSGIPPEYVLRVYHDRRHYGWYDIAIFLGIHPQMQEFIILRNHHDMRDAYYDYNYRRKERYEERYRPPVVEYRPAPRHYVEPQRHYEPPRHESKRYESEHRKPERHESKREVRQEPERRPDMRTQQRPLEQKQPRPSQKGERGDDKRYEEGRGHR